MSCHDGAVFSHKSWLRSHDAVKRMEKDSLRRLEESRQAPVSSPPKEKHHLGWTHSKDSESWFLEAKTPSIHDDYIDFYVRAMGKK